MSVGNRGLGGDVCGFQRLFFRGGIDMSIIAVGELQHHWSSGLKSDGKIPDVIRMEKAWPGTPVPAD